MPEDTVNPSSARAADRIRPDPDAWEPDVRPGEARFRALVEASSQIVWTSDAAGGFAAEQPAWAATGQSPDEYRGFGWLDAVHPKDRDRTAEAWSGAVRQVYGTETGGSPLISLRRTARAELSPH